MSLNYLNRVLQKILTSPELEVFQEYQLLLDSWQDIVTPEEALNTRLLYISNNVLFVATSSSVWAQNLSFKRHMLLQKLNDSLPKKLANIRFSPGQWYQNRRETPELSSVGLENHPSFVNVSIETDTLPLGNTPQAALERWLEIVKRRSHDLPLCPQCQVPTPQGELDRWGICSICATKQWQD
jgi:predicted nucleic acid-binding Zn ribbon protein